VLYTVLHYTQIKYRAYTLFTAVGMITALTSVTWHHHHRGFVEKKPYKTKTPNRVSVKFICHL